MKKTTFLKLIEIAAIFGAIWFFAGKVGPEFKNHIIMIILIVCVNVTAYMRGLNEHESKISH